MPTVYEELSAALGGGAKPGETPEQVALRLAKETNKKFDTDETWQTLSEEAQGWVVDTLKARDNHQPIPSLPGYEPGENVVETQTETKPAAKKASAKKAAPKASAKKTAPPKKADKANGAKRGRKGQFDLADKIQILAKENPRRGKLKQMFEKYKNGMTVEQALGVGITRGNMRRDVARGNIKIG